jgi:SAM-dependent methyltransferase
MNLVSLQRARLMREWHRQTDSRIPPPTVNYNQYPSWRLESYVRVFKERACLRELPFLMKLGMKPESSMLDYGCGLGRVAYAASQYLTTGRYFGWEPNAQARAFLREAYRNYPNFLFDGDELRLEDDYVAISGGATRGGGKRASEVELASLVTEPVQFQYSSSVTTHMWLDDIQRVLRQFRDLVQGYCVNTWLIVDDFAEYVMRCGLADRRLPLVVNGAFVKAAENPLDCTAYRLNDVLACYEAAGHEVVDVKYGSWSGRDNGIHYQDVVVSRPK